jgi:hypothetical protein
LNIEIIKKTRFDDVGDADENGFVDYAYQGFNYRIAVGQRTFTARTYDDEPGVWTISNSSGEQWLPEMRELAKFLISSQGCTVLKLYRGTTGGYAAVDPETMEFTSS